MGSRFDTSRPSGLPTVLTVPPQPSRAVPTALHLSLYLTKPLFFALPCPPVLKLRMFGILNPLSCPTPTRHGHGEAFSPVCLPHFNADAFLHAHIHYLDEHAGAVGALAGRAQAWRAALLWC